MNRVSCPRALLLIPLVLACFALSPQAKATCQEGCLTNSNTVLGDDALLSDTGSFNTAIGANALQNASGTENTATGFATLVFNTGFENTANGSAALYSNTTGDQNTATGASALFTNTIGEDNTATGFQALHSNSSGFRNTANGFNALAANTSGSQNTADGANSLFKNTTGAANVAIGYNALLNNTTGGFNTALGTAAGSQLTTGSNNIDIANKGIVAEANTIRIGTTGTQTNTYIAGISGVTVAGGVGVITDSSGHLGTVVSSARFKTDIKAMDKTSEAVLSLKPVTFRYKHDLDPEGIPQFGLVAEEVEKVNSALVARDEQGKPYTVRYEAVNAMLLNEFLKEHKTVQELKSTAAKEEATIAEFKKEIASLAATVKQQASQLQKVSAQAEINKPVLQTIANNQ